MAKVRWKETSMDSFFVNFLYEQKVRPNHFPRKLNLVDKDLGKGIEAGTVAADRGYDDRANHYYLRQEGTNCALSLHDYRTAKKYKNKNKEGWIRLKQSFEYEDGLKSWARRRSI